ncbi:hypothetical protein [Bradyrhizobium japonicum]|uniref:hypothetical protein n=1 Tax=Bradyrhizobium japonicum TaxID=375 RepID=UPI00209F273A|nr:hypothetical protein [Bradyrhizobium japonicum]MCP1762076.1 hypothetical protein [Bradyrhizobium japonicum]MCP1793656.1 hypothetical protein [Bradyrhizobium japonicum]MCP1806089.1 hypothetical protein [Bradyrhizobium japonicum]MCP1815017.1 hypothetical protein [Bradyrhizobium japonicum]MCP1873465.1 hypothetical protein [Bradyrhizobium japonicum]
MSALSSTAALPLITTPSIAAAPSNGIPDDLAASSADFYGRWREQRRRDEIETAEDPDLTSWHALNSELFDLQARIMNCQPRTADDLVLQARVCALVNSELWTDAATVEAADAGARSHRQMLENVAALVGSELLPGTAILPL